MMNSDDSYLVRCEAVATLSLQQAPHVLMRPKVFLDGDMWCALYGDNIQEGVCGFGDTPEKACVEFNKAWFGRK